MRTVRLIIADVMEIVRLGLPKLLESQPDIKVVGVCGTGYELIETALREEPDVIILDAELRACDCIEATRLIHDKLPSTHIIIFSYSVEHLLRHPALIHGASGYLTKDTPIGRLIMAITLVADGEVVLCEQAASEMLRRFESLDRRVPASVPLLTKREREVLASVALSQSNKDVAAALCISEYTVKVHMRNIMKKVHTRSRGQAAAWFASHYH